MHRRWRSKLITKNTPNKARYDDDDSSSDDSDDVISSSNCRHNNVDSFCQTADNILSPTCQQFCPRDDPANRASWCDNVVLNYCHSTKGLTDPFCSCFNSPLHNQGIPSVCFDSVCHREGYKPSNQNIYLSNCGAFCS